MIINNTKVHLTIIDKELDHSMTKITLNIYVSSPKLGFLMLGIVTAASISSGKPSQSSLINRGYPGSIPFSPISTYCLPF